MEVYFQEFSKGFVKEYDAKWNFPFYCFNHHNYLINPTSNLSFLFLSKKYSI